MATVKKFEDLEIWKMARELSKQIFDVTKEKEFTKDYRLKSQINAAGSVMDNIAEGFERNSQFEFINFLTYSKGSTGEVRSQLYRSFDYKYINEQTCNHYVDRYAELASKISNFIKYLKSSSIKGQKFKDRN